MTPSASSSSSATRGCRSSTPSPRRPSASTSSGCSCASPPAPPWPTWASPTAHPARRAGPSRPGSTPRPSRPTAPSSPPAAASPRCPRPAAPASASTAARAGVTQSLRYDPLLAKVVVHERHGDLAAALRSTGRALAEFDVRGVATNTPFLRALLADPDVLAARATTTLVDEKTAELVAAAERYGTQDTEPAPTEHTEDDALHAPVPGTVVAVEAPAGTTVEPGGTVVVLEAMKMEHGVAPPPRGTPRPGGRAPGARRGRGRHRPPGPAARHRRAPRRRPPARGRRDRPRR